MTAALAAAVVIWVGVTLPPGQLVASSGLDGVAAAIPGAVHIHTNRSDGRSSPEEVAASAARAGLAFVIFTDHGDATRMPDPPAYRSGVLCIDAVEISTEAGHLVALGLPASPYPLAGEARDVLEDVHRLGGIGVAAHPDSPKADLEWRAWTAPIDGLEVINLDTEWRTHAARPGWGAKARLLEALAAYPFRGPEAIASLMVDHPGLLARWDAFGAERRMPMLAGVDAHARLALRGDDGERAAEGMSLALPSYESVFKTLSMRLAIERPLTGEADADAALVLDALRRGRAYATVDAIFAPGAFEFTVKTGETVLHAGDEAPIAGPVVATVRTNAPASFTTTLVRNGTAATSQASSGEMVVPLPEEGAVVRVEIRATDRPGQPIWLLSNAIYLRSSVAEPTAAAADVREPAAPGAAAGPSLVLFDRKASVDWHTEVGSASKAAIDVTNPASGRELEVRYGLPGGDGFGQFAAAVADVTGRMAGRSSLRFTIRADRPMRVSVQLRVPRASGDERWRRSVYASESPATYVLPFPEFTPLGDLPPAGLDVGAVHGVLFAVDRVNSPPSASGRFQLTDVVVE